MSFHRCCLKLLGILLLSSGPILWAAPIQPFDAVVQPQNGDEVFARSGPGIAHHYPTLKLAPGDKVRVLRKDPGGWYMIEPPPGSFSWVIARYVQKNGPVGVITENGVVVRVGAYQGTQRDVEQVRLNRGDQVEILGEQVIPSDKGQQLWLKIKPPRGERRWVKGSSLVELNPDGSPKTIASLNSGTPTRPESPATSEAVAVANTPKTPSTKVSQETADTGPAYQKRADPATQDAPLFGHSPQRLSNVDPFEPAVEESSVADETTIRESLVLLDHELQQILTKPAGDWELRNQIQDLNELQELAGESPVSAEVARRLSRVKRLQQIHEDAVAMSGRPATTRGVSAETNSRNPASSNPAPSGSAAPHQSSYAPPPGAQIRQRPPGSRFDGAGIVHRMPNMPPGLPQYVIAAPNRRILCFLDADPSIKLEQYIGRSVGLTGQRYYDPNLRNDRMFVQEISQIRLAQ